jgi:hypothetical protein
VAIRLRAVLLVASAVSIVYAQLEADYVDFRLSALVSWSCRSCLLRLQRLLSLLLLWLPYPSLCPRALVKCDAAANIAIGLHADLQSALLGWLLMQEWMENLQATDPKGHEQILREFSKHVDAGKAPAKFSCAAWPSVAPSSR